MSLCESVRRAAAEVSRRARFVRIDDAGLEALAARLAGEAPPTPDYDTTHHHRGSPLSTLAFNLTLDSINSADPTKPTVKPVPYVGVQFVAIPEFQGLGTTVGQLFSAALAGQMSVDDALKQAQDAATSTMTEGGYIQ